MDAHPQVLILFVEYNVDMHSIFRLNQWPGLIWSWLWTIGACYTIDSYLLQYNIEEEK